MRPVSLPEALEDIDRLYNHLVEKNPIAAQKAMLAIDEGIELLLENPYLGSKWSTTPFGVSFLYRSPMFCAIVWTHSLKTWLLCVSGTVAKIEAGHRGGTIWGRNPMLGVRPASVCR